MLASGLTSLCTTIAAFSEIRSLEILFERNTTSLQMLQTSARRYRHQPLLQESGSLPHNQAVASRLNALLQHTSGRFEATDPRDLFYALHGPPGNKRDPKRHLPRLH